MKLKYNLLKSKIDYVQPDLIKNDFIKLLMRYKNIISIYNSETIKINKNIEKLPYNLTYDELTNEIKDNFECLPKGLEQKINDIALEMQESMEKLKPRLASLMGGK